MNDCISSDVKIKMVQLQATCGVKLIQVFGLFVNINFQDRDMMFGFHQVALVAVILITGDVIA